jgi:CRISPR-associated protein Csd1
MILQALNGAYARFAKQMLPNGKPRVPPYGFSYEKIDFALVIDRNGKLIDVAPVDADLDVPVDPMTTRASGILPMFLWDKTAYVLGLAPKMKERTADEHAAFKALHANVIGASQDEGLRAVLSFLDSWQPDAERLKGFRDSPIGSNVVFRLDNESNFIHDRDAAKRLWLDYLSGQSAPVGRCLITAEDARIALTHPTIGGVRDAQTSGASIVSFNQKAFVSYGKEQGENAPVSEAAAFAYTTALNELLRKGSRQKVQIGDAATVFWAEAGDPADADAAERSAGFLFAPTQQQLEDQQTGRLAREVMQRIKRGIPLDSPELHLRPGTRFYILGLSPNAARLSVRFWEATTLGGLGAAFHEHWRDLHMETSPRRGLPPSVAALALRTAPARIDRSGNTKFSFDDVSPRIAGELMRAILTRGRYPASLLATLVMRVRTDQEIRSRAPLIKAILVRAMRLEGRLPKEDYLVRSDPDDTNPARRLGRLFAVLERTQAAALGGDINATIKDKYLGSAAATPGRVFPGLIKNAAHHTARLRKGHTDAKWVKKPAAAGFALDRDIGQLTATFNDGFPSQQSIEEQGLFLVGYYQERFGSKTDGDIGDEPGIDSTEVSDNADGNNDHEQE